MTRYKNAEWNCGNHEVQSVAHAQLAVLMDIRDELQALNRIFQCHNFLAIPQKLDAIAKNTQKKKRRAPQRG